MGEAQVVDDEAAGLVAEHAVDARDGLHQPVAAHRLVDIHRVQAGRVETGEPHVPHEHDPQRIGGVAEPLGQRLAPGLLRICGCQSGGSAASDRAPQTYMSRGSEAEPR